MTSFYKRWMYHQHLLPAGKIIHTPEELDALGDGWVDTPAKFLSAGRPPTIEDVIAAGYSMAYAEFVVREHARATAAGEPPNYNTYAPPADPPAPESAPEPVAEPVVAPEPAPAPVEPRPELIFNEIPPLTNEIIAEDRGPAPPRRGRK